MSEDRNGYRDYHNSTKLVNRRGFLKTTAAALGVAAMGVYPGSALAAEEITVNGLPGTVLGRTGLKITRISFGGILSSEPSVLFRAIDQGIRLVHTSPGYQNGRSIEAFGKVMKTRRDKVVLAVKVRPEKLDECLEKLNTDYADIIIPPMDSIQEISDPVLRENFEKAKAAGKVGHMGFACHTQSPALLDKMRDLGFYDIILMSYSDTGNPAFIDALGRLREAGIGILAMKGLPKRSSLKPDEKEIALTASLCTSMVGKYNANTVLASIGSFQALEMYYDILETKLGYSNPVLEERYRASLEGNYCAMCGNCTGLCPQGLQISNIIRFRMYRQDYGLAEYAKTKYAAVSPGCDASSCRECGLCEISCTRKLPLRQMLKEAHRLLA